MLEIDGSKKSGSGTILRLAIALSGIITEPLHIYNIRQKRRQPGLSPQHLESVNTAAKLCNAETEGAKIGSRELWFKPNSIIKGEFRGEIGPCCASIWRRTGCARRRRVGWLKCCVSSRVLRLAHGSSWRTTAPWCQIGV